MTLQRSIKGYQVFWKEETLGNTLCILGNQIVNVVHHNCGPNKW